MTIDVKSYKEKVLNRKPAINLVPLIDILFTIMIFFGLRTSLLGGIIVITLLIIPIFVRSMDEVARQLPKELLDATYSLGATRLEANVIDEGQIQIKPGEIIITTPAGVSPEEAVRSPNTT